MRRSFYRYILQCSDGSLYMGYTDDLERTGLLLIKGVKSQVTHRFVDLFD
jgi:predicted GIY-YIG superfamily endonuclease